MWGLFSFLRIREKALLCVVWAGGSGPVPITKVKVALSSPPVVPWQLGLGAWSRLSQLETLSGAYDVETYRQMAVSPRGAGVASWPSWFSLRKKSAPWLFRCFDHCPYSIMKSSKDSVTPPPPPQKLF